ncbi:TetR family transcriptional regulator [Kitasatospora sp. LaBMicrA B282]|uniref:TetR/AcrR family transcriptional regulator n=1 Tax=Kitasatospora sp. LaBMicrA B282 TaxID=3420949 RepID=UPI003D1463F2
MTRNTEETRRKLKAAATEEFAAFGPHGTTVDRIARRAGVNKERLYNYFGDKEQLFATVLSDELAKIAAAVPLASIRVDDIGDFAGRTFDYHAEHPHLVRLLHWEGLAFDRAVPEEPARTGHYQQKVKALLDAQASGSVTGEVDAAHFVFLLLAISAWWFAVPQIARMLSGAEARDDAAERARQRETVVWAARRLAESLERGKE